MRCHPSRFLWAWCAGFTLTAVCGEPVVRAEVPPTPNQLVITEVEVDLVMAKLFITGSDFCADLTP